MQNLAYKSCYWRIEGHELANPDLAAWLTQSICDACQLPNPNPRLHLLLGEIINNAIDHGVLGLGSEIKDEPNGFDKYFLARQKKLASLKKGWVSVTVDSFANGVIQIEIEDSGAGFDYNHVSRFLNEVQPEAVSLSGRGLLIIDSLCESMAHIGNGNCIVVEFDSSVVASNDSDFNSDKHAIAG